jgi:hypothetical protein
MNLPFKIFLLLHILFSYVALLKQDFNKICDIFSMTHMYFTKILQMNTLCSMDNTSDHHLSTLQNTTNQGGHISAQMTQFMTCLL